MKSLTISRAASADLRKIYAYTIEHWGERQADTYLDNLRTAMDAIAQGTALLRPLAPSRHQNMYKLRQGQHLIICTEPTKGVIQIVRILHGRMDIDANLEG